MITFLVDEGISGAIIGPPAKRHDVSLACRCDLTWNAGLGALLFFRGSGQVLLKNLQLCLRFFNFAGGGGVTDPLPIPPLDPRMLRVCEQRKLWWWAKR